MKHLCLTTLLLLILGVPSFAGDGSAYTPVTRFDAARDADRDIQDAVAEAARTGRRVLLDVGGEWCVWCRRLDTLFVRHPDLEELRARNFVTAKVNWSRENKNEEVLSRYPKITGYPHLFVLDSDGTLLHSQETGSLEKGKGHDPEKVRNFLETWAPRREADRGSPADSASSPQHR